MFPHSDQPSACSGDVSSSEFSVDDGPVQHRQRALIAEALREVEMAEQRAGGAGARLQGRTSTGRFAGPAEDSFTGYQIIHEIHRGGQGVVYRALQKSTQRTVAIKVMKEGPFAGVADRARFDREVRILAALNHKNIVAIHDSGEAAGQFFFVMDFIGGQPLDAYMAAADRTVPDTLRLFLKICEALNTAHLRGIIHRDLKPSNIRVDDDGEPHILDFGLAKISSESAHGGLGRIDGLGQVMTVTGQFVGSLPWASPEQADGASTSIDLRADVYSLGVILYQMLTGRFPYDVTGPWREVLDRIVKVEPVRPRLLRRQIDDEVETIVLKCLSKERERRYQTAGELARDIGRYLAGEPIEAKRDSAMYMLHKAILRHRAAAIICTGYLVVVTLGLVVALRSWRSEQEQRVVAEGQRDEAQAIMKMFRRMVASSEPGATLRVDYTLREALDSFSDDLHKNPPPQPAVEAAARAALGNTYWQLGDYRSAESHLRRALELQHVVYGHEHLEVARSLNDLGLTMQLTGRRDEAIAAFQESLAIFRKLFGDDHHEAATIMQNLGNVFRMEGRLDEAEPLLQIALDVRRRFYGEQHPYVAVALTKLAKVVDARGDHSRAEAMLRESLDIMDHSGSKESPGRTGTLHDLAAVVEHHNPAAAEGMYRESLAIRRQVLGDDHLYVAISAGGLASLLHRRGELDEAEALLREVIMIRANVHHDAASAVLAARAELAAVLTEKGEFAEAEIVLIDGWSAVTNDSDATAASLQRMAKGRVDLYEAWDAAEPDMGFDLDAAEWRAVLERLQAPK